MDESQYNYTYIYDSDCDGVLSNVDCDDDALTQYTDNDTDCSGIITENDYLMTVML